MGSAGTTPMMQQYLSIKERYPDAILFYRMGDFYEMFFEDAEVAAKILEITLTSRSRKSDGETPIPMCGVPVRAAQGYIARMISAGKKVAICEQTQDAASAKGLVEREVVRVITPGMIIEDAFLDERSNNYILAAAKSGGIGGIAWLDISTGDFRVTESKAFTALAQEVLRIGPSEVLLPGAFEASNNGPENSSDLLPLIRALKSCPGNVLEDRFFEYRPCYERLIEQFATLSLEGFGCEEMSAGICAAGALLGYVRETQKDAAAPFTRIRPYTLNEYLLIDDISARNLELTENLRGGAVRGSAKGTLLSVLDKTVTAMGSRMLKSWLRYPLSRVRGIRERLEAVAQAKENPALRRDLRARLDSVYDLERIGTKVVMGRCCGRDLVALKRSLYALPGIAEALTGLGAPLYRWGEDISTLEELADHLDGAVREDAPLTVNEGGIIKAGYSEELDELIRISSDGKGYIARMESREREQTRINTLKIRYNKVFGYFIEISKGRSDEAPDHYIRKQTLANAERFITDELKNFETKVLRAEEERASLEFRLFDDIRKAAAQCNPVIQAAAGFLASLDCLLTLAEAADLNGYVRPTINTDGEFLLEDGRHPVIEKMTAGERFVPNSLRMDDQDHQILIITGPNMAGKSTVLRQTALVVLMAHMGSFVPAKSASVPLTDRIFTRVGALDNLSEGQSTFMVEMQETANILNNATPKSLVILDEIGRGTSTFDGLSIAWAVAEYLHDLKNRGVKTLFATHYHELTALEGILSRVKNYNIAVKEWRDEIIFLRRLVPGGTNRSYGIQVARLAGIPDRVIQTAKSVLEKIEAGNNGNPHTGDRIAEGPPEEAPVQLDLFDAPARRIIEDLQGLDISRMTPLDALNRLHELQRRTKGWIN